MSGAPGWYPDPSGRFEHRYHNGQAWTADVAVGGRRFVDPGAASRPCGPAGPSGPGGVAVAALVLGIVAASLGWVPFLAVLTLVAAVVAIVLGAVGRGRARRSGAGGAFASWGLALGVIGIPVSILGLVLTGVLVRAVERYEEPNAHDVGVTSCTEDGGLVRAMGWITNRGDDQASFTIRVELAHRADARRRATDRVEVDDVAPGATVEWRALARPDGVGEGAPACAVTAVHGPLPFGFDPDQ